MTDYSKALHSHLLASRRAGAGQMIKQLAGSEVPLSVKARHLAGFTRSNAG
jgi:hypothetical protein